MKRILIVAVIMAMLMSGCSVMMSTMEQGATQPTVEEMLAQALQLCNAGNYEEAIAREILSWPDMLPGS